jgi:hypothetical protein
MDFFANIGKFFGDVGKAISGAVTSIAQAVSSVAGVLKDVAGAVGSFINDSPLGGLLKAIPGVGTIISTIGSIASTVVAGSVQNFANQAVDFGKSLGGDVGNGVSATALGSTALVNQQLKSTHDLARFSHELGRPQRATHHTAADRAMARLGTLNYAQLFAQRQAELMKLSAA